MIQVTIRMIFEADKKHDAVRNLLSTIGRTRVETGCISCSLISDAEDAQVVVYEELWRDEEDLELHQRSDAYRMVSLVFEMASTPPDIRIDTITSSSGMELIEKVRMENKK